MSDDRLNEPTSWQLGTGLLALLAICLVPAVMGAALYLNHLRELALRDAYRAADLVAIGTSDSLRWLLQDAEAMLTSVAARPRVRKLDSGIGLAPAQLERPFEPFNRVGAERTGVEGHGLGLAHSRALARSMGGDITVTSQLGRGSCFTLHLHRAGPSMAGQQPARVR